MISPDELHSILSGDWSSSPQRIVPVAAGREAALTSFETKHIPGSVYDSSLFFNMDKICDTASPYPLMLPTPSHFASCMANLGIRPDDILVIFDTLEAGMYFSARAAWIFRYFGHTNAHVLNNFPNYVDGGYPVSGGKLMALEGERKRYPSREPARPEDALTFEELNALLLSARNGALQYQILDSRPATLFSGAGHMPFALNIPLGSMLDEKRALLPAPRLRALFEEKGVDETLPAILSCNSGTTAATLGLALQVSGYNIRTRIYDGSWSEWSTRADEYMILLG
ncbi:hypothetical protein UA08_04247 [Talaromyces atroroseus]|uniref:Rhodanese domain-containing protein n=1 Tax=Talaromyces atroroseus TaxID=1441469 RepID=A0A1Q5Q9E8_TALAT|nr:hypothetical protein UA08_04247 [Talaromyces atroroseus]OKL60744.1 hypothetical protein UA08_04247 [Talaromyces atroroseus]